MSSEKKVTLYGTMECGDTVSARELLDGAGVVYGYVDVLGSLGALREFMNIRDTNPELFEDAVKNGGVGIPIVAVEGGMIYNNIEDLDLPLLK